MSNTTPETPAETIETISFTVTKVKNGWTIDRAFKTGPREPMRREVYIAKDARTLAKLMEKLA